MTVTTSTQSGDFVKGLYEAFNRGDIETVLDGLSDDITWTEPEGHPLSSTHHGPNGVLEGVFAPVEEHFDHFDVRPERFIERDDVVVVEGEIRATSKAGRDTSIQFAHICEVQSGELTQFTSYVDTALMTDAINSDV